MFTTLPKGSNARNHFFSPSFFYLRFEKGMKVKKEKIDFRGKPSEKYGKSPDFSSYFFFDTKIEGKKEK